MANGECEIYGCRKPLEDGATVTVEIDGVQYVYNICTYHGEFFRDADPLYYSIGLTFTQEPEIRVHPAIADPSVN